MNIALIGPGLVGTEFLRQIKSFNVIAVASSTQMSFSNDISKNNTKVDLIAFLNHCEANKPCIGKLVYLTSVVDCTSSQSVVEMYIDIVLRGLHIVTPNKKGFSGSIELFRDLKELTKKHQVFVKHESSVGAGLPILSTLMDLVDSGLFFY
jgi:homoserine dehydrogenase